MDEIQAQENDMFTENENVILTFILDGGLYGIDAQHVKEITQIDDITSIADSESYIKGVVNLRGEIIPALDLRVRLGLQPYEKYAEHMIEIMHQRENDHINWLKELEACVNEKRPFKLARDPHKCAFGKWYDKYETVDKIMQNWLEKFDQPHKNIHKVADKVLDLSTKGETELALKVIESTRNRELNEMIRLFNGVKEIIDKGRKNLIIILNVDGDSFGISVDSMDSVVKVKNELIESPSSFIQSRTTHSFVKSIVRFKHNDDTTLCKMLDVSMIH